MSETPPDITRLLDAWRDGDQAALNELMPMVMADLKRIAGAYLAREAHAQTFQTTALINEAYLRLVGVRPNEWEGRAQFFALAAQIMRRILVDHARARGGSRRGGAWQRVNFDEALMIASDATSGLSELDDALMSLGRLDPRKSQLVELRLFGGLTNEEASQVLGVSHRTIDRDWQFAKAWLARELQSGAPANAGNL
jgi:RNA polymerase sigma factor (TIGR02999 family)